MEIILLTGRGRESNPAESIEGRAHDFLEKRYAFGLGEGAAIA